MLGLASLQLHGNLLDKQEVLFILWNVAHQNFQSMQTLHCDFNKIPGYSSIKSVFCWHDFAFFAKGTSAHLYEDKVGRQFCVHQVAFGLLARMWTLYIQNLCLMTGCAGQIFAALENNAFSTVLHSVSMPFYSRYKIYT